MEKVVCDICEQDHAQLVYRVKDTNYGSPGAFSLVQCSGCNLVYQNPRPSQSEIGSYYPVETYHPFRALHQGGEVLVAPLVQKRVHFLSSKIKPGKVLDVGCGSGHFLLAMQQKGWHSLGVEPNEAAARLAREKSSLNIVTGDIFSLHSFNTFDLITFWDVLEHTHSPKAVLQHAHQLLRPNGYLALNVPNWGSLERRLFQERWIALDAPRHLYHFTPETLKRLLVTCNFSPEFVRASGATLSLSSNVLRWMGDTFLRKGQAKALTPTARTSTNVSGVSPRQILITLVHHSMKLPNLIINGIHQGSGIMALAQKKG
jgi:2-polyprenyl-3-methyl-5-hydroxy-6-metoxy-1,4-benzoquinol methylase